MIQAHVKLSLEGLKQFKDEVNAGGEIAQKILKVWAARYRAFAQRRFSAFSRGGGDWPPLAPSTIAGRRRGRGRGGVAILFDTGTLFRALDPTLGPGGIEDRRYWSVTVGYGGPSRHPSGSATIADIASFHQSGGGHLPQRKVIDFPSEEVESAMAKDAERLLNERAKEHIEHGGH